MMSLAGCSPIPIRVFSPLGLPGAFMTLTAVWFVSGHATMMPRLEGGQQKIRSCFRGRIRIFTDMLEMILSIRVTLLD